MNDEKTVILTDIKRALQSSEKEAHEKPAALLVVGGDLNGTIFDLVLPEITVGRLPSNNIPLDFRGISRQHFKIRMSADSVTVEDLDSKNGTFLNNQKLEGQIILKKGDIIKLGSIALKYIPAGDPERLSYDKLAKDATTDGLTGCYNKTYSNNAIEDHVKKSKVTGEPLSLMIFDIDHFKHLNDNYGHDAGDSVLKELASLIKSDGIRQKDVFGRYGGEEFIILLPETNIKQGFEIAERLRQLIEEHKFVYDNNELPVKVSIGIADYRKGIDNGTDLFKRADQAVYKAKKGGRNQVQFYRE